MKFHGLYCSTGSLFTTVAVVALLILGGCSDGGYSGPSGDVTGTVKVGGKPAPDGTSVTFISDKGHTGSGTVSGDGKYQLVTVIEGSKLDTVPVGSYRVCVTPPASAPATSDADYEKQMQAAGSGKGPEVTQTPASAIPAKYHTTTTSGLSFDVKEGPNTIDIELQ